jgi:hypothetical protein
MLFFHILATVVLPIFVIIGVGFLVDRLFHLDMPTLSKLNFYVFIPALTFVKFLQSDLSMGDILRISAFAVLHMIILYGLSTALFSVRPLAKHRSLLTLSAIFCNVGNYGIPLTILAFGNGAVGVIAVLILVQNLLTFTVGIVLFQEKREPAGASLKRLAGAPMIYAIAIALVLRALSLQPPPQIQVPLDHLAGGLVPIALLTLGAQLSRNQREGHALPIAAVSGMRLFVSPLLAAALLPLFHFAPSVTPVLIVAAGMPVAMNVYILAAEYDRDANLSSQLVFWTTLVSAVTLSLILAVVR